MRGRLHHVDADMFVRPAPDTFIGGLTMTCTGMTTTGCSVVKERDELQTDIVVMAALRKSCEIKDERIVSIECKYDEACAEIIQLKNRIALALKIIGTGTDCQCQGEHNCKWCSLRKVLEGK